MGLNLTQTFQWRVLWSGQRSQSSRAHPWLRQPTHHSPFPGIQEGMSDKDFKWWPSTVQEGSRFILLASTTSVWVRARLHARTHAHRGTKLIQKFEVCPFEVGKKLLVYRRVSRQNRSDCLSVALQKCVESSDVIHFAGTRVQANTAPLVDSLIQRTGANEFTRVWDVPESECRRWKFI